MLEITIAGCTFTETLKDQLRKRWNVLITVPLCRCSELARPRSCVVPPTNLHRAANANAVKSVVSLLTPRNGFYVVVSRQKGNSSWGSYTALIHQTFTNTSMAC